MLFFATLATLLMQTSPTPPMPGPQTERPGPHTPTAAPGKARKIVGPRRREPEDWALALPRAVLFLPRVVLTGVFTPVSRTLARLDDRTIARIKRAFLWNRAATIGWTPVLSYLSAYGFTGGARVFHRDLLRHRETLSLETAAGGLHAQVHELRFYGDDVGGKRVWIDARVLYDVTPRLVFQGIGVPVPRPPPGPDRLDPRGGDVRSRYSQERALAAVQIGYRVQRNKVSFVPAVGTVFNHRRFGPGRDASKVVFGRADEDDPSIEQAYDVAELPGFREGVDVARLFARFDLDGRDDPVRPTRGAHWFVLAGGAPPQAGNFAYAHYGTELAGYVDLFKRTRILAFRIAHEAVAGDDTRIPFSDLPRLGGPLRLRGYRLNRFRDRKMLLATLEYRYPIHQVLAGHLFVDAGRVARTYRELFEAKARPWRVGFGGGLTFTMALPRTSRRLYFRIDLSYGEDFLVFFSTDPLRAFADRHLLDLQ